MLMDSVAQELGHSLGALLLVVSVEGTQGTWVMDGMALLPRLVPWWEWLEDWINRDCCL